MTGCDVASAGTKALGEGAHHDVNVRRVDAPVFRDSTTSSTHGTNAVSLIKIHIGLKYNVEGKKEYCHSVWIIHFHKETMTSR